MMEGNTLPRAWGLPCFLWRMQRVNQLYLETVSGKETADASQSTCDLAMLLICLDDDEQIPSSSCFGWFHSLISSYPLSQRCFLLPSPKVESMANSRRIWRESSISDWQANSELNVSCLGSVQHLCDVVFFSKKMTLILRYTEGILCDRKSWVLGVSSRMILHVKSMSSSTIYGITLYPKHRKEPNVGWSLTQSFQFSQNTSANFKVDTETGTSVYVSFLFRVLTDRNLNGPYQNIRTVLRNHSSKSVSLPSKDVIQQCFL